MKGIGERGGGGRKWRGRNGEAVGSKYLLQMRIVRLFSNTMSMMMIVSNNCLDFIMNEIHSSFVSFLMKEKKKMTLTKTI